MTPEPATRPARAGDLPVLVDLWDELIRHHAPLDSHYAVGPVAGSAWRRRAAKLVEGIGGAVFVCGTAGVLQGFCSVELRGGSPLVDRAASAEITDLFVVAERRRSGCGRALVAAALEWLRSREIVRVEVRVLDANREGQAFWRALGWGDFVDVLQRRL